MVPSSEVLFDARSLILAGVALAVLAAAVFLALRSRSATAHGIRSRATGRSHSQRLGIVEFFDLDPQRQLLIIHRELGRAPHHDRRTKRPRHRSRHRANAREQKRHEPRREQFRPGARGKAARPNHFGSRRRSRLSSRFAGSGGSSAKTRFCARGEPRATAAWSGPCRHRRIRWSSSGHS